VATEWILWAFEASFSSNQAPRLQSFGIFYFRDIASARAIKQTCRCYSQDYGYTPNKCTEKEHNHRRLISVISVTMLTTASRHSPVLRLLNGYGPAIVTAMDTSLLEVPRRNTAIQITYRLFEILQEYYVLADQLHLNQKNGVVSRSSYLEPLFKSAICGFCW
jgi:hypothetical protein